jgi:hypothetical protein
MGFEICDGELETATLFGYWREAYWEVAKRDQPGNGGFSGLQLQRAEMMVEMIRLYSGLWPMNWSLAFESIETSRVFSLLWHFPIFVRI